MSGIEEIRGGSGGRSGGDDDGGNDRKKPDLKGVFQHPAMIGALQSRLDSLIGKPSSYLSELPKQVHRRLNALLNLQDEHAKINAKFREEVAQLEKKYLALHEPLYSKRAAFVAGAVEPTEQEATRQKDEDEETMIAEVEDKLDAPVHGVPEFWLTALRNHPLTSSLITERDEEALKSLKDIKYQYLDNNPGFKLIFYFDNNDFFENKTLEKTYFLDNSDISPQGDIMYDHAEGTLITWREGKDLSVTVEIKKQRHKASNKTRTVKKTVPAETFFNFFNPPKPPQDAEEEDIEQDLEEKLEMDYEVGDLIKEKIIPFAVDWYTGKALEYEDDMEGEDDEDGEFYGEDGEDDEDEDGEGGAEGASGEKPPECKQQ